jgi:hypothetical protein
MKLHLTLLIKSVSILVATIWSLIVIPSAIASSSAPSDGSASWQVSSKEKSHA